MRAARRLGWWRAGLTIGKPPDQRRSALAGGRGFRGVGALARRVASFGLNARHRTVADTGNTTV